MPEQIAQKGRQVPALKIFAFDYASGGGPAQRALPPALRHQGEMMLRALLADLVQLPGIEVITLGDPALPMPDVPAGAQVVADGGPFARRFNACVQAADAVWPVAPESGGLLESLSRKVLRSKRILLGSKPGAVRLAGSKLLTGRALAKAGIAVAAAYAPWDSLPAHSGAWVVKPEHGAGCVDTRIFSGAHAALDWIAESGGEGYVLQPFIPGKVCSLSLLCRDGVARLLSCNEQRIAVRGNQFHFLGSTVNCMADSNGEFERLGQRIAALIPGLWGHVGVDFILAECGVVVLEINPRMTTSYAGLHAAIGCNPAALVLDLLGDAIGPAGPQCRALSVSVDAEAFTAL